jgi:chromosome partitioning protein
MEVTITNLHLGTGKTATTLALARALVGLGKKVLVVDLDPKFGVAATLGLAPRASLHDLLFRNLGMESCLASARENLEVICSDSTTYVAEERLRRESSPQLVFEYAFSRTKNTYDAVLFDVGPGFSWLQVAALCYTRKVLVPVTTDVLGLLGACSAVVSAQTLRWVYSTEVEVIGFLPVMIRKGTPETEVALKTISAISKKGEIKLLPGIEYDDAVPLAARNRMFLADYCAKSCAAGSYEVLAKTLMDL